MFKKIHLLITNEAQITISTIRTNNGGEYTSRVFENYLQENVIKHQTTIPYNPQQNGVVNVNFFNCGKIPPWTAQMTKINGPKYLLIQSSRS